LEPKYISAKLRVVVLLPPHHFIFDYEECSLRQALVIFVKCCLCGEFCVNQSVLELHRLSAHQELKIEKDERNI
jgi:hypothetical protein